VKILLMTQYYSPEGGSCAAHMAEMAEYLAMKGHNVTVVTGFPNYPNGKVYTGYRRRFLQREKINDVIVIRTFVFVTTERHSFGPRMANYLSFMLTAIWGGLKSGRHELIYFYSPPLFLGVTASLLGLVWKVPVIMELNDLWPRAPISLGVIKNRIFIKVAEFLEAFIYKHTSKIFSYSKRMRQEILKTGISENKVEIHNLWIDSETFKPVSKEEAQQIRKEFGLNGKFVVMYTGLVGMAQGLDTLVDSAGLLKMRDIHNIIIAIVGGGPERDNLIARAKKKELDNILFVDQQPRNRMASFMSAADILVSHLRGAPHRVGTIPAKILSYMAAGKPVLVGAEGEAADLIKQYNCGIAVLPDDSASMSEAIICLSETSEQRLREMSQYGQAAVKDIYEKKKVLALLERRLINLVTEIRMPRNIVVSS